jgi:2-methylcitrate dehydratase PrpD
MSAVQALPSAEDIDRIEVVTYHLAAELNDPAPNNTLAAKFSVPFAVATRLVHGHSQLSSFTWEAVRNRAVLALAQKVVVREDKAMNARLPHERPAHVRMLLTDGSVREAAVGVNRGDDASPYTDAELHGKFMSLCTRVWSTEQAQSLYQATVALSAQGPDQDRDWSAWCQMLAQAPLAALPTGA